MDGNNPSSFDLRMPRADLVVWIRVPRRTALAGVARRVLANFGEMRIDIAEGCPEQLADPARPLPEVGRFARIAPGETVEFAHDVRLPTAQIRTLRQGEAQLYIPLLRVRVQAGSNGPVARTFLVGTLPDASAKKLQPFRLDEMPQTYRLIGVAALD